jgi:LysR family hydrogen peroxide-inducible transcriptional activator
MIATLSGLSLRDLEYAVAVSQERHFGRAALRCGVSQPALSEQIRKLENLLGVALFERGRRGVQVTQEGEALLHRAERVLAEAHGLLEMARGAGEPHASTLHVAAIQTLGPYYLPFLLRTLRAGATQLALRFSEGQTDPLLELLRAGAIDILLAALPLPDDGLETMPLFREPFALVCPAGHPLAEREQPTLSDLDAPDLILLEEGHCLRDQALALCAGSKRRGRYATSLETLWHMIAAGEGFSLLPALSLSGRSAIGDLVACRPLPQPEASRTIALAWRTTDPRGAEFRRMASLLRASLPEGVTLMPEEDSAFFFEKKNQKTFATSS